MRASRETRIRKPTENFAVAVKTFNKLLLYDYGLTSAS